MSSTDITARAVMDSSAAMNNDSALTVYTYAVQLPYLNMALRELQEHFEQNNIPVTNSTSAALTLPAGTIEVSFISSPALPSDLVEIQQLWERAAGINPYTPMTKMEYLPHYLEGNPINQFLIWIWEDQKIKLLPAKADNDIKLDYIKNLFATFTITDINNHTDTIGIINSYTFLSYRTGALCAQFIGEDKSRADDLNSFAVLGLDRVTSIGTKGRQAITTRRRPFRQSFKTRNNIG